MEIYSQNLRKYFRIFSDNHKSLLKLLSVFWPFVFLPTHTRQYNVSDRYNQKPSRQSKVSQCNFIFRLGMLAWTFNHIALEAEGGRSLGIQGYTRLQHYTRPCLKYTNKPTKFIFNWWDIKISLRNKRTNAESVCTNLYND